MAEIDEIERFIQSVEGRTNSMPGQISSGQPIVFSQPDIPVPPPGFVPTETENYIQQNQIPGIPLSLDGIGGLTRIAASFRGDKEDKIRYLQSKYGSENVRLDKKGEPIVRIREGDENSPKIRDVIFDEPTFSGKDIFDVLGFAPEIIGGIAGLKSGRGIPFRGLGKSKGSIGALRDITSTSVGSEAAGALKDISTQAIDPGNVRFGEIAGERAALVPLDMAFAGTLGLAGKVITKTITPFGRDSLPQIQVDAENAVKYFRDKFGVEIPLSLGERTGNTLIQRSESLLKKLPGSPGPYTDLREARTEAVRDIQSRILGTGQVQSEDEIGKTVVEKLRGVAERSSDLTESERMKLVMEANKRILDELSSVSPTKSEPFLSRIGQAIRTRVFGEREVFRKIAADLYEEALNSPGGRDKILSGETLSEGARKLREELASALTSKQVKGPIVDQMGNPITYTKEQKEILDKFIPEKILPKLNQLIDLKGAKVSYEDLKLIRTEVANDIKMNEAIPGVQTHYLDKIVDLLTGTMEAESKKIPNQTLYNGIKKANEFYSKGVPKFKQFGIAELFRETESPNFIGNDTFIRRIISGEGGTDKFVTLRDFLGKGSQEFNMLKRAIADDLIHQSTVTGDDFIDAKSFIKGLDNLYKYNREIADEVFGKGTVRKMMHAAGALETFQLKNISSKDFIEAMLQSQKSGKAFNFGAYTKAKLEEERLINNGIIRAIKTKQLPQEGFDPEQFITSFVDKSSVKEISQIMDLINTKGDPQLLQDIRRKMIQRVLLKSQRNPVATDPVSLKTDPTRMPSSESIMKALGGETEQAKIRTLLGDDIFRDFVELAKALRPSEAVEQAFSAAGGLSAGQQIGNIFRNGELAAIPAMVKNRIIAGILTTPGLRKWAGNNVLSPSESRVFTTSMIASEPMVEALIREYGTEGARAAGERIKYSIDKSLKEFGSAESNTRPRQTLDEFMQSIEQR